jgi:hypothetical protein
MKMKALLTIACLLAAFAAAAQTSRQDYVGHYVFLWENQQETFEIALRSDGSLGLFYPASKKLALAGESSFSVTEIKLKHIENDRFEFPQYGGIVVFERNEKRVVTACVVSVAALNINEIKALKQ